MMIGKIAPGRQKNLIKKKAGLQTGSRDRIGTPWRRDAKPALSRRCKLKKREKD